MMHGLIVSAISVSGLSLSRPAHAVLMSNSDEGTIDVIVGPQNGTAYITLTFDVQKATAHVERDELAAGDAKHAADWHTYVQRFPVAGMQLKTHVVLRNVIHQSIKYWRNLNRIEFKVFLIVSESDGTSRRRLFEDFECKDDCLSGKLPEQQNLSRWAVQQLDAEEPQSKIERPLAGHS